MCTNGGRGSSKSVRHASKGEGANTSKYIHKKVKVLPMPMVHRAVPISVSVALGHMSSNAVKATAGGWSTGSSACLTFPLYSLMSSTRREGSEYHL